MKESAMARRLPDTRLGSVHSLRALGYQPFCDRPMWQSSGAEVRLISSTKTTGAELSCNQRPAARSITITPNESGNTGGLPFPAGSGPNFAKAKNRR